MDYYLSLLVFCLLVHSSLSAKTNMDQTNNKTKLRPTVPYDLDLDIKVDGKRSSKQMVPALYVFGDSAADPGNNNFRDTRARANFLPYGIDFAGITTGRFTNGKTSADILARKLGLPYPPPYLGLLDYQRRIVTTGVNYASAACGILPETAKNKVGDCLSLDEQIHLFKRTVKKDLPGHFNGSKALSDYLSKSLFSVTIGANDYFSNSHDPNVTFAKFLAAEFSKRLQRIYHLGARKFILSKFGPAGCTPSFRYSVKHKGLCDERVNKMASLYDAQVSRMIQNLQSKLPGSIFVSIDISKILHEVFFENPRKYGMMDWKNPCCGNSIKLICAVNSKPAEHREHRFFFDYVHSTQAANNIIMGLCFNESSFCIPMNIEELVKA